MHLQMNAVDSMSLPYSTHNISQQLQSPQNFSFDITPKQEMQPGSDGLLTAAYSQARYDICGPIAHTMPQPETFQAQHFSQGQNGEDFNNLSSSYMANSDANFHLGGFSAPLSGSANLLDDGLIGLEGGLEENQHYSIPLDAPQNFQSNQGYTLGEIMISHSHEHLLIFSADLLLVISVRISPSILPRLKILKIIALSRPDKLGKIEIRLQYFLLWKKGSNCTVCFAWLEPFSKLWHLATMIPSLLIASLLRIILCCYTACHHRVCQQMSSKIQMTYWITLLC